MSVDNWTICPKCKTKKENDAKKERLEMEASYGKVTSSKYLSLIDDLLNKEDEEQKTLREDYGIGMDELGTFSVNYSASCTKCKFKYSYDYVDET